jgi:hypothetical protein
MRNISTPLFPEYVFLINEFHIVIKTAFKRDEERQLITSVIQEYLNGRFFYLSAEIKRHTDHFYYCGEISTESDRIFSERSEDNSINKLDVFVIYFSLPGKNKIDSRRYSYNFDSIYKGQYKHNFFLPREASLGMVSEVTDLILHLITVSRKYNFTFYGVYTDETQMDYGRARYPFTVKNGLDFYDSKTSKSGVYFFLDSINRSWYQVREDDRSRNTVQGIWKISYDCTLESYEQGDDIYELILNQEKEEHALEVVHYSRSPNSLLLDFLSVAGQDYYTVNLDITKKNIYMKRILEYHNKLMDISKKYGLKGKLNIYDLVYKSKNSIKPYELCFFVFDKGILYENLDYAEAISLEVLLKNSIEHHP